MNIKRQPSLTALRDQDLVDLVIDAIQDIKGKRITKLDLRDIEDAPVDFFIICEGESNTQVKALANHIHKRIYAETGIKPNHIEGEESARWILVDYFTTIVHIFHPETRTFYELEDLWSDAKITYYENL